MNSMANSVNDASVSKAKTARNSKLVMLLSALVVILVVVVLFLVFIIANDRANTQVINNTAQTPQNNANNNSEDQNSVNPNPTPANPAPVAQSYKDYILANILEDFTWEKNDVTGNRMNTYELTLVLNGSQEQNYDTYTKADQNLRKFLDTNKWVRTLNNVEGNASITQVYTNPTNSERSITIKEHATAGSPSLNIIFNYLPSDQV